MPPSTPQRPPLAFAVVDGSFPWTRSLFSGLAPAAAVWFAEARDLVTSLQRGWRPADVFRLRRLAPNLYDKRYVFPPGWFSRLPAPFMRFLSREIRNWLRPFSQAGRILVITLPHYVRLLSRSGASRSVYYWSDEFRSYWPHRRREVEELESRAVAETEATICASWSKAQELKAQFPTQAHKIHFLMHGHHEGVRLSRAAVSPHSPPPDLRHLRRPLLGHWGQISNHLDFCLLAQLATAFPQASLVLIGPLEDNIDEAQREWFDRCRRLANIHWIGPRPLQRIGDYLPAFDINLVLYRPELEFTRVTNPSKVRDYLAASRPIVSTPLPDLQHLWKDLVHSAATRQEFLQLVGRILAQGSDGLEELRLDFARAHTWRHASRELLSIIARIPPHAEAEKNPHGASGTAPSAHAH